VPTTTAGDRPGRDCNFNGVTPETEGDASD
jgi:hypothetical protein